ncbi:MAG: hypothetical protein LBF60_09020 [Treponema sp.]|jgi:hypothetical protein|nr:hypothetical protein [Treponema sp.]
MKKMYALIICMTVCGAALFAQTAEDFSIEITAPGEGVGIAGYNEGISGYDAALHSPVNIEAGKVNEIAIEVTALTSQWNTSKNNEITAANKNDFAFYATLENFSTGDDPLAIIERRVHLAPSL